VRIWKKAVWAIFITNSGIQLKKENNQKAILRIESLRGQDFRKDILILKQKCQIYGIGTLLKTISDFMNGNMGKVNFYACRGGA
jgi:hypothetical protein